MKAHHLPAEWAQTLTSWSNWLTAAHRTPSTVQLRAYHVETLATFTTEPTPWTVSEASVTNFLANNTWALATRRSYRASITQFYRWALNHDLTAEEPTRNLLPVRHIPTVPRPAPDDVILEALHQAAPRERVMLLLASEAGLRRAEIAKVHTNDFVGTPNEMSLLIHGKGNRERLVPVSKRLEVELNEYRETIGEGWLFPSPRASAPIGAIRVGELVAEALPAPWTCHTLRHRFATAAYQCSKDLLLVQRLLGHSKPETTAIYIQLDLDDARQIVHAARLTP